METLRTCLVSGGTEGSVGPFQVRFTLSIMDGAYGVSSGRVCCITVGLVWTLLYRSTSYFSAVGVGRCRGTLRDNTYALKPPFGCIDPTLGVLLDAPSKLHSRASLPSYGWGEYSSGHARMSSTRRPNSRFRKLCVHGYRGRCESRAAH